MGATPDPPVASSARVQEYRDCSHGERTDAIEQLAALLSATTAELLDVITAADAEGDWQVDGATSMPPSLMWLCHVGASTAREWVRVGKALDQLPHLRAAFHAGLLSWDQIRPATTYATPSTDAELAEHLPSCSAATIEARARQHRLVSRRDAERATVRRGIRRRIDHENHGYRYSGFLPADEAAVFNAGLDRKAEQMGPDAESGVWDTHESRCADALVALAQQSLTADPGPDPTMVVVHVSADVIDGNRPGNGILDGLQVGRDTVLRMLCDTTIEYSVDGPDGTTVGIGRAGRTIPRWLRRRIKHRDGTCRFPGCERQIRQIHHIRHWVDGGVTDAWSLVGLCWCHHHLVHEGGWTLTGNADHELTFTSPYGRVLSSRPARLRPEVRQRAAEAIGMEIGEPPPPEDDCPVDDVQPAPPSRCRTAPADDPLGRLFNDTRHGPAP